MTLVRVVPSPSYQWKRQWDARDGQRDPRKKSAFGAVVTGVSGGSGCARRRAFGRASERGYERSLKPTASLIVLTAQSIVSLVSSIGSYRNTLSTCGLDS
jgi:hypothetical protein